MIGFRIAFPLLLAAILFPAQNLRPDTGPDRDVSRPERVPGSALAKSNADAFWARVVPQRPSGKPGVAAPVDWAQTVSLAREFQAGYPNDPRAREARKIEMIALLKQQGRNGGAASPDAKARIEQYVVDTSIPGKDRFDISILMREVRKDRSKIRTHDDSVQTHIKDARELIAEFPDDSRSYGYMLSAARNSASAIANEVANELIRSSAPEKIKAGARRLLAQRALEGKPLNIRGLALGAFKGRPVLLYTWSARRPEMIRAFEHWAVKSGVAMIGINIDSDMEEARRFAQTQRPPGLLLYDGGGLDGPVVSQLHLQMPSSVYLIDRRGVLVDTCGHLGALGKITALQKTDGDGNQTARRDGGEK